MDMNGALQHIEFKNKNLLPEFIDALYDQEGITTEIIPLGLFNRLNKFEIEDYDWVDAINRRYYFSNRPSIYDGLPKHLFHSEYKGSGNSTVEDANQTFKQTREEERAAREFFYPIDRLLQDVRLFLAKYNCRRLADHKDNYLCLLFDTLWSENKEILTAHQKIIFMTLVAHRPKVMGNLDAIKAYLELFTGENISYLLTTKSIKTYTKNLNRNYRLGINFTLGAEMYENMKSVSFKISPITVSKIDRFLTETNMHKAIRFLLSAVMPIEADYNFDFTVNTDDSSFALNNRLGYSLKLK